LIISEQLLNKLFPYNKYSDKYPDKYSDQYPDKFLEKFTIVWNFKQGNNNISYMNNYILILLGLIPLEDLYILNKKLNYTNM
jgi:hypothetical protein